MTRLAAVVVAVLAGTLAVGTLTGCTGTGEPDPAAPTSARPVPSAVSSGPPTAALAGGACLLFDFSVINKTLGSTFDAAAAAASGDTYTCDVTSSTTKVSPDLALSVTATILEPLDFTATVEPSGAQPVGKLGKIAYVLVVKTTAIEIGWLSGNDRLIIMRYTFPDGATAAAVTALKPKLITLAQTVDATTV